MLRIIENPNEKWYGLKIEEKGVKSAKIFMG